VETGLPKTAEEIATMEGISLEEAEKIVEELKALQASSENSSSPETSSTEASVPSSDETTTQSVNEYMKLKYWHVETGLPKTAEEIATMEGISLEEAEKIVEELKALQASSENSSSPETSSTEASVPSSDETTTQSVNEYMQLKYWHV
ncbi:hypothetical protein, partial [Streptococcus suis]|uniref:hypothetical protein n=1 Tax=Streptococcus suis TaxID=1307 RepID=UPI001375361F